MCKSEANYLVIAQETDQIDVSLLARFHQARVAVVGLHVDIRAPVEFTYANQ
jgi:hypothetical protein